MRKQNIFSWVTDENMEVSSGESGEQGENLAVVKYSLYLITHPCWNCSPLYKVVAPFSIE